MAGAAPAVTSQLSAELVQRHLELVHVIARKVKKTIGKSMDFDDLVGYGSKGLMEAAQRFDPTHSVAFSTFAYYRIRGAMFDGLRTMGWYSRSDYARYRAEERANEYMRSHAYRQTTAATPESPDAALEAVAVLLSGIATVHITSLEAAATVADDRLPVPDAHIDTGRLSSRARELVKTLPARERQLIELYYFADKNLEQVGEVMGLSKSWACRLHARAIDLLREAMGTDGAAD